MFPGNSFHEKHFQLKFLSKFWIPRPLGSGMSLYIPLTEPMDVDGLGAFWISWNHQNPSTSIEIIDIRRHLLVLYRYYIQMYWNSKFTWKFQAKMFFHEHITRKHCLTPPSARTNQRIRSKVTPVDILKKCLYFKKWTYISVYCTPSWWTDSCTVWQNYIAMPPLNLALLPVVICMHRGSTC